MLDDVGPDCLTSALFFETILRLYRCIYMCVCTYVYISTRQFDVDRVWGTKPWKMFEAPNAAVIAASHVQVIETARQSSIDASTQAEKEILAS